ncbi:MAG: peptide chain release factor N(5)-glutamine methyltransferase [Candidatus Cloacimonadaceae bacterium]|nr:peptide chain release factor N(5)-glutamine methyltransferase [Candidatus Cloacimonadaceae bacterium]MDP3114179.1 peptide chain release factor N(5)-glutamine methyltransferase [Candidatus Cloacimonadaceae bacterium]
MKIAQGLAFCNSALSLQHEIKYLLSELSGLSVPELALHAQDELEEETGALFLSSLERLRKHEPVQYILGRAWFWGLELEVNPAVLIPRHETELLVELALKELSDDETVIDIGTGSGAIAIALKKERPGLKIIATDISPAALETAKRNAESLACEIDFRVCDIFPEEGMRFDLIISNPPYVSEGEFAKLDEKIRLFEPSNALLAMGEGLDFYRKILSCAPSYLKPGGRIIFEHGYTQREAIKKIAFEHGFKAAGEYRDLNDYDRCLVFTEADGGIDG